MAQERLHSGARWSFRLSVYAVFIPLVIVFSFPIISMMTAINSSGAEGIDSSVASSFFFANFFFAFGFFVCLAVIFGEIYARLAYNNYSYEFSEHSLKVEKGIIWKKYSTVPYERVQNVDIRRGILARMLGFSTLDIQTAGAAYGNRGTLGGEGHIPAVGVKRAEEIREFLMKKISRKSGGI